MNCLNELERCFRRHGYAEAPSVIPLDFTNLRSFDLILNGLRALPSSRRRLDRENWVVRVLSNPDEQLRIDALRGDRRRHGPFGCWSRVRSQAPRCRNSRRETSRYPSPIKRPGSSAAADPPSGRTVRSTTDPYCRADIPGSAIPRAQALRRLRGCLSLLVFGLKIVVRVDGCALRSSEHAEP